MPRGRLGDEGVYSGREGLTLDLGVLIRRDVTARHMGRGMGGRSDEPAHLDVGVLGSRVSAPFGRVGRRRR